VNPQTLNDIWSNTDPKLWVVTAAADGGRGGLVATFVNQASIVPDMPRVLIGLARHHNTCRLIHSGRSFGLHLFAESQIDWVWRFGGQSGRECDKLIGLNLTTAATGCPLLADALAWLDCRVEAEFDTGDRTIFLGAVADAKLNQQSPPLTVQRMLKLLPAAQLQQLKAQFDHDATVDAKAIATWRGSK